MQNELARKELEPEAGSGSTDLLRALQLIVLARQMDAKMTNLLKQGKSFFHISGAGHEAAQVAFGLAFRAGLDWAFPYYRDLAFMLAIGTSPEDIFLHALAKRDDPMSGGRQMSCHWASKELNVPSQSSPTGSQFLQAVGVARALREQGLIVYVSGGEGSTSQGEFHEAVNWASRDGLPVVFVIQNNKWAISVPVEGQTGGRNSSVAEMMKGYERLTRLVVDGTDYPTMQKAARSALSAARAGSGPVLVEAQCVRLSSHSSSDDQKKYRSPESMALDRERDPLDGLARLLRQNGVLEATAWDEIRQAAKRQVDQAADWAMAQPDPEPETASAHVLDESGTAGRLDYEIEAPAGEPVVMVDAINHALAEELQRNDRLCIFGEDVADGKGGVFTATRGLSTRFGPERVFNSPLAEASIVGVAIGMALAGLKPCVEIQFGDYIWPAFQQIRDELVM
jgi:2-oxoisovalerate dehydrogenase E1 component